MALFRQRREDASLRVARGVVGKPFWVERFQFQVPPTLLLTAIARADFFVSMSDR